MAPQLKAPPPPNTSMSLEAAVGQDSCLGPSSQHDVVLSPSAPCPAHVAGFISSAASRPGYGAVVTEAVEIKSAQQFVCIVKVELRETGGVDQAMPPPQAPLPPGQEQERRAPPPGRLHEALRTGHNRLVVRVWKGSARWWNLNANHVGGCESREILDMARSEVAGYRVARASLGLSSIASSTPARSKVIIPEVLYFSHDYSTGVREEQIPIDDDERHYPWAIFSYVGENSIHFSSEEWNFDGQYAKDMVKIRHEFGFDEPHPRHGRVEARQSLDYAVEVLESVVLPLQNAFFSESGLLGGSHRQDLFALGQIDCNNGNRSAKPYRYHDMIRIYEKAVSQMTDVLQIQEGGKRSRMCILIDTLKQCIRRLVTEADDNVALSSNALPSVLCHMDLQPQNMVLRRRAKASVPQVSSVLDWEEACYADPRFEVLLMGRKVCASRDQADELWAYYSQSVRDNHSLEVGPIIPWLKLETVHSITTLVMQGMNLVGGGRNPWESKPDLLGKIEREFCRLIHLGWDFCERAVQR